MPKRILTVTSGKGGVGKTTLAVNLGIALSRYGRTVLVDQDFETGSVRSFLDVEVKKDLYHFIARDTPMSECITRLPERWDPDGRYRNFGIVATPKHYIEDVVQLHSRHRDRFVEAIHALPADFVLLDMKAGLSDEILRFLPYTNSGILIFTPRLPAATAAAAYLVKAQLFRKLHLAFEPPSPLVEDLSADRRTRVQELLHRADDVYDDGVENLDHLLEILREELGDHPAVRALHGMLSTFRVHYVLNHFDGVESSYENAVAPFVRRLAQIVSSRLQLRNLGWVELDPAIHDSNCRRVPAILAEEIAARKKKARAARDPFAELEALAEQMLGPTTEVGPARSGVDQYLEDQLDQLHRMFGGLGSAGFANHFRYIASSAVHLMDNLRSYAFGDTRLHSSEEIRDMLLRYHES